MLITVTSVIAIPAYYSRPAITLDSASRLLARDLRYCQNEAVMRGTSTRAIFEEFGDGYKLETARSMPLPNPVGGGNLVRVYSRNATFEGVRITTIAGISVPVVRFDRDGFCLDEARIELHYKDEVRTVHIDQGSGLLTIHGLDSPWADNGL